MFRSPRRLPHLNAQVINNGLDWLTAQHGLNQAGRTPFTTIARGAAYSVRYYAHAGMASAAPPVVLVPPLAVQPSIFDLLPQRSLVRYLCARGFDVYLLVWNAPGREHDQLGLAAYALTMLPAALRAIRRHSTCQHLSLLGYCLGGLFALLHAGTGQDTAIAGIVTLATPVDLHADAFASALARRLAGPAGRLPLQRLPAAVWRTPGPLNALAFKLASPGSAIGATRKLLQQLANRDAVAAHATMRAWLRQMDAYPGALVRDLLTHVWLGNALTTGALQLDGQTSDLAQINCPLLSIAGSDDPLVGPASTGLLLERAGSTDTMQLVVPGGHVGVLAGARAPDDCWPRIADWLASRAN